MELSLTVTEQKPPIALLLSRPKQSGKFEIRNSQCDPITQGSLGEVFFFFHFVSTVHGHRRKMSSVYAVFSLGIRSPENRKKPIWKHANSSSFAAKTTRWRAPILRRSFTVLCELKSGPSRSGEASNPAADDFVTRVLKENPSQVEPRYRAGDKLYNQKEREDLSKGGSATGAFEFIKRKLDSKTEMEKESSEIGDESVYLSDLLREYKGKLYVPEQVFGPALSEEEGFEKSVEELPKMSLEDFRKAMKNDKVKLLTSKEASGANDSRDFIVDLKEIPGVKSLQRTKW